MVGIEIVALLEAAGANIDKIVLTKEHSFSIEEKTFVLDTYLYDNLQSLVKDIDDLKGELFVNRLEFIDENKISLRGLFVSE